MRTQRDATTQDDRNAATSVRLKSGSQTGHAIPTALISCEREWPGRSGPELAFTVELQHHGEFVSVSVVSPDGRTVSQKDIEINEPLNIDRSLNRWRAGIGDAIARGTASA